MIRYADADREALHRLVAAEAPEWLAKAARRTAKFIAAGRYDEEKGVWSEVKTVYMRLQKNKCVFCERQFENERYGKIEFDVEHFRPKSSVADWPDPERHAHLSYDHPMGDAFATGYYWLAYDLQNYAASCKACNSTLKGAYFPVAGRRGAAAATVVELADEQAYLCYPLDAVDDDPEDLLGFVATTAVPAGADERRRRRGRVIIDFFDLNGREQLHRQRAQMISIFGPALAAVDAGRDGPADRTLVSRMTDPALPHANCLRSYRRLWSSDPALARRALDLCREFVVDETRAAPPEL